SEGSGMRSSSDDFELYVVEPKAMGDNVEALFGFPKKVDPEKFKSAYESILVAARFMYTKAKDIAGDYTVDEITLALGVSAEGGLAFIATAGVTADITITLKRKAST